MSRTVGSMVAVLLRLSWGLGLAVTLVGCIGDDATGPAELPELKAVPYAGDGQFAEPGTTLPVAFEVLVRRVDGDDVDEPVLVEWELVEGEGGTLSRSSGFTDPAQRARTFLTLGSELTLYRVRAVFPEVSAEPVEFWARAVRAPTLTGVSPDPVVPGGEVELTGSGFVPELEQIDVLFSGIRARVLAGTATSLRVEVPPCLNEDAASVRVGLGSLVSATVSAGVDGPPVATELVPGEALEITDGLEYSCTFLPGDPDAEYLAVVHSAGRSGFLSHDFSLVLRHGGSSRSTAPVLRQPTPPGSPLATDLRRSQGTAGSAQHLWERQVRESEAVALIHGNAARGPTPGPARAPAGPARVPAVGDRREFSVLNGDGGFDRVRAEVRYVSDHAVIYVDEEAPDGGFESLDLEKLGREFDDPIHETVLQAFGSLSDLDENDRVVILFTPTVNRLTEEEADGFVGGFFYGIDLLPGRTGSNGGEIFYALVPDPEGLHGQIRSRTEVLFTVPAILAHELQHMVHFNERVLVRDADRTDATWLAEALAHTAEELVADAYRSVSRHGSAIRFEQGNYIRARNYLAEAPETSLLADGSLSLEARGAAWLFLNHVRGEYGRAGGGERILGDLTRTTRTGVENVTEVVGQPWENLVAPWTAALYLDELAVPVDSRYLFRLLELRSDVAGAAPEYPLQPAVLGEWDHTVNGELFSASGYHVLLEPTGPRGLAVALTGRDGIAPPPLAELGLTLIRLR